MRHVGLGLAVACVVACRPEPHAAEAREAPEIARAAAPTTVVVKTGGSGAAYGPPGEVSNRFAYIPPQCYAKTDTGRGRSARNPCYTCHTDAPPPNYVRDGDLQVRRALPKGALQNRWQNLFDPPVRRAPPLPDEDVLRRVRTPNYLVDGENVLALALRSLPAAWDGQGDGKWDGFVPDVGYRFDEDGFDHLADGTETGWRAFAYYPLPGAFMPTNGSIGDVLVRLAPEFRQNGAGEPDRETYVANLAIVEALASERDVAIAPVDEARLGTDLDLDGRLGVARRVAFRAGSGGATSMHYAGKARTVEESGELPIAAGLFPVGTEFFHTVRYLDVGEGGRVVPAARLKEIRYARKQRWYAPADLKAVVEGEAREQAKTEDGSLPVLWAFDHGIDNGQGWNFQGFIEDEKGSLRPQTFEETAYCAGCHGGVGRTTDSIFSFSRKLPDGSFRRGWFHFSQRGLQGVADPRTASGDSEYGRYLREAAGGDDYAGNEDVRRRFLDDRGALRPDALSELRQDVTTLLLPSRERALALDRAYLATVREQSFIRGRDTLLGPVSQVVGLARADDRTGVERPIRWP
ncbi:MAG TPA: hypothetical protein VHE30_15945 [Polyangiaceae bacterium]|nr:hypothetical protein [Polyangiaceae bacterium]